MTAEAERIRHALDRHKVMQTPYDEATQNFIKELQKDIEKTILEKYPFLEVSHINDMKQDDSALATAQREAAQNIRLKGYAFDSLVLRYEKARDAQMRAEQIQERKDGGDGGKAQRRAERDKMRFIQILDDVIGDHD